MVLVLQVCVGAFLLSYSALKETLHTSQMDESDGPFDHSSLLLDAAKACEVIEFFIGRDLYKISN